MMDAAKSLLILMLILGSSGMVRAESGRIDVCDYKMTFDEPFDRLDVTARDATKARWIAHTPWNGDFGDAQFVDPGSYGPFFVKDGMLTIEARKQANGKWTSGLLASADGRMNGFSQLYGYFEARMKLPPGPGVWPAFWLGANKGVGNQEPAVEIDVVEYYGREPNILHNVLHVWFKGDNPRDEMQHNRATVPAGSLSDEFHTYGVDVGPAEIVYYLDRRELWRVKTPKEHDKPLLLMVNLALGPGWPIDKTPSPSHLLVDYVRAYAADPGGRSARCPS